MKVFVWTLRDLIAIAVGCAALLVGLAFGLWSWFNQALCKHEKYFENMGNCHAVCQKCGKDLGFIGSWEGLIEMKVVVHRLESGHIVEEELDCKGLLGVRFFPEDGPYVNVSRDIDEMGIRVDTEHQLAIYSVASNSVVISGWRG